MITTVSDKDISQASEIEQLRQEITAWSITAENLEAERDALKAQDPVEHQYQSRDGQWLPFINEGHYQNTLEDGSWPIRSLFLAAGAAPVQQEQASFRTRDAELWLAKNKLAMHEILGAAPKEQTP